MLKLGNAKYLIHNSQVFLALWAWYVILIFVGILRILFLVFQVGSARLRFYLLKIRMYRYFKKNKTMNKVRNFICQCSQGDWFVLYQLSKNLNKPYLMDLLVSLVEIVDQNSSSEKGTISFHTINTTLFLFIGTFLTKNIKNLCFLGYNMGIFGP